MELRAATRLLAEGEWFHELSKESQKQYITEHPDSKYAHDHKSKSDGTDVVPHHKGPPKETQPVPHHQNQRQPAKVPPKAIKRGSPQRKRAAEQVKAKTPGLIPGIFRDSIGAVKGVAAVGRILQDKRQPGDVKKIAGLVGTILGSAAMVAVLGTTGPVGFLAFMALKHLAAPDLFNMVKTGLKKGAKAISDHDNANAADDEAFDNGDDEEEDLGYWEHGKWHPQSRDDWERDYTKRGKGSKRDITGAHTRLLAAEAEDHEMMQQLIGVLADLAANGDIPDEAFAAAQAEMDSKQ